LIARTARRMSGEIIQTHFVVRKRHLHVCHALCGVQALSGAHPALCLAIKRPRFLLTRPAFPQQLLLQRLVGRKDFHSFGRVAGARCSSSNLFSAHAQAPARLKTSTGNVTKRNSDRQKTPTQQTIKRRDGSER
jgi:hypothetical protein